MPLQEDSGQAFSVASVTDSLETLIPGKTSELYQGKKQKSNKACRHAS